MKKIIGVDIGNYSMKLIELENKKSQIEVVKCALEPIVNGDIKSALKELLSTVRLSLTKINVSLSGPSVIVRYIEMPPMKKEELKSAIKFEAEKYMPFSISDSIIDCAVLDKSATGLQRVLLVGAKKSEANKFLQFLKESGLEINVIDSDSFALLNCFEAFGVQGKEDSTYALVNIGERFSNMNIVSKGNVYFTRDILWGGQSIRTRIRDMMGVSLQEAEVLKRDPGDKKDQVINVTTTVFEKLASQIGMSFDYFESQFGKTVESLYISGGSSYLFNIIEFLKNSLDMEVTIWDPFQRLSLAEGVKGKYLRNTPSIFCVAIGLALRK